MADGGLKLELDEALSERLRAAAAAADRSIGDFAAQLISRGLDDQWSEAISRLAEYDRTGEYVDADEALSAFRSAISARLRKPI